MSAEDAARKLQEKFGHGSPPTREDAKGYLGEALAKVRPAASARPKRWRSSICACPKSSNTACAFSRRAIVWKCPISSSRQSNSTKIVMAPPRCSSRRAKAKRAHASTVSDCRGRGDGRHAPYFHAAQFSVRLFAGADTRESLGVRLRQRGERCVEGLGAHFHPCLDPNATLALGGQRRLDLDRVFYLFGELCAGRGRRRSLHAHRQPRESRDDLRRDASRTRAAREKTQGTPRASARCRTRRGD